MTYVPAGDRYERMPYRQCGRSGLRLPAISLGLWHNFGDDKPFEEQRAMLRRAFDLGVTHFDLANNYGPPFGSAETNFGRHLDDDFRAHRDELVISSKAGWDMWPGPYGIGGSRKYLLASLEQSLQRMRLDYVDIFYSHRFDPETPLEETMGALDAAVRQGKALYVGISSYSVAARPRPPRSCASLGTPLLIHQPNYHMSTAGSSATCSTSSGEEGVGCIAFSPGPGHPHQPLSRGVPRTRARPGQVARRSPLRREPRARARAERDRRGARADARADGDRLDAARSARDVVADRRLERRAARELRRRPRERRLRRRGARRDRAVRRRRGMDLWEEPATA
jgi:L-glyceraldehyde 3-phosphate reductase